MATAGKTPASEPTPPTLNGYQRHELRNWLKTQDIEMDKLHLLCRDGVLIAKIMKPLLPNYVHLQDYTVSESVRVRLKNWETLNEKVLKRAGIPQTKQRIQLYVNGTQEADEELLYVLMELCESDRIKQLAKLEYERRKRLRFKKEDMSKHKVLLRRDGQSVEVNKRFLPYAYFTQAHNDYEAADDRFTAMQLKNEAMQLKLKEASELMEELSQKLASKTVANIFELCKIKRRN